MVNLGSRWIYKSIFCDPGSLHTTASSGKKLESRTRSNPCIGMYSICRNAFFFFCRFILWKPIRGTGVISPLRMQVWWYKLKTTTDERPKIYMENVAQGSKTEGTLMSGESPISCVILSTWILQKESNLALIWEKRIRTFGTTRTCMSDEGGAVLSVNRQ